MKKQNNCHIQKNVTDINEACNVGSKSMVNLVDYCQTLFQTWEENNQDKGITLQFHNELKDEQVCTSYVFDQDLLTDALENTIQNIYKKDYLTSYFTLTLLNTDPDTCVIRLQRDGHVIAPDDLLSINGKQFSPKHFNDYKGLVMCQLFAFEHAENIEAKACSNSTYTSVTITFHK